MDVIHTICEFRQWRRAAPPGVSLPFVPTMGALHEGHISLVHAARETARAGAAGGRVIASIFVNPTQFGPAEDLTQYPRTLNADLQLLESAQCNAVFVPDTEEMYEKESPNSQDASRKLTVDPGPLGEMLEGAIRPGHFRGVCTVVAKLLNIVQPTHLLLGQKDFQQQAILRQMCADLNVGVEVVTCPTMREPDGLAMSSRNRYLSARERPQATALHEALSWAAGAVGQGQKRAREIEEGMRERIAARGLLVQYATVRRAASLENFNAEISGPCVLLVAAKLGPTRLIDNCLIEA